MKLELKHLAPYLPYELKVKNCLFKRQHFEYSLSIATIEGTLRSKDLKPILRPLSDLTKEIEHNGEKFVPIDKLDFISIYAKQLVIKMSNPNVDGNFIPLLYLKYSDWEKLFEWHFDVFGLIDAELAVKK